MNKKRENLFDKPIVEWVAKDHFNHDRGPFWMISMLAILVLVSALGFFYGQATMSLAFIAFAFAYYVMHKKSLGDEKVIISKVGIKVGKREYSYAKIKSFWVIYEPPHFKSLNFKVSGDLAGDIRVELEDMEPSEIKDALKKFVPEQKGKSESLINIFLKFFKI